ncbi:MAG: transcription elongation factor subunit Spt4 [Candidatus Bathyarchaeia archaeon]
MSRKACRSCHRLTTSNLCPDCKTTNVSNDWTGVAIVLNPEWSQIAKKLGVNKPGRYALTVR